MSKEAEITFMQTRLIRLASEEWHLPIEQIIKKCAKRKQMIACLKFVESEKIWLK